MDMYVPEELGPSSSYLQHQHNIVTAKWSGALLQSNFKKYGVWFLFLIVVLLPFLIFRNLDLDAHNYLSWIPLDWKNHTVFTRFKYI